MATSKTSEGNRINTGFVEMTKVNLHLFYTEWRMLPRNIKCKHINNALMEEIDNSVIRIFRVTDRDEKFMIKNILPK